MKRGLAISALSTLVTLAISTAGCSAGKFFTGPGDYSAYRATKTSPSLEGRIQAAEHYLGTYRDGAFKDEVRDYLERAEPAFYASKQGSSEGLRAYLRALPDGAHRVDAE